VWNAPVSEQDDTIMKFVSIQIKRLVGNRVPAIGQQNG
jgi:hypothetical protein